MPTEGFQCFLQRDFFHKNVNGVVEEECDDGSGNQPAELPTRQHHHVAELRLLANGFSLILVQLRIEVSESRIFDALQIKRLLDQDVNRPVLRLLVEPQHEHVRVALGEDFVLLSRRLLLLDQIHQRKRESIAQFVGVLAVVDFAYFILNCLDVRA